MRVLEIIAVCFCCSIATTAVAENTSVDLLLDMFARQEVLMKKMEQLTTLKFTEVENKLNELQKAVISSQQNHNSDVTQKLSEILSYVSRICPCDYTRNNFGCYKFYNSPGSTWEDAKTRCEADGGHLVEIESDKEMKALRELMVKTQSHTIQYWIGGKRINGRWLWVDKNQPFGYTHWHQGYPRYTGDSDHDCAVLQYSSPSSKWHNAYKCSYSSSTMHAICEI